MKTLSDTDKMPFGQFRDEPMEDVPANYLHFLWHDGLMHQESPVANYIRTNLSALRTETPDLIWADQRVPKIEPKTQLEDGLWQVTTSSFVAGFVVRQGKVKKGECAPILQKNLAHWAKSAIRVGDIPETVNPDFLYTKLN